MYKSVNGWFSSLNVYPWVLLYVFVKKDIPRIELGLLDSKSNVLTITPYVLAKNTIHNLLINSIQDHKTIEITTSPTRFFYHPRRRSPLLENDSKPSCP